MLFGNTLMLYHIFYFTIRSVRNCYKPSIVMDWLKEISQNTMMLLWAYFSFYIFLRLEGKLSIDFDCLTSSQLIFLDCSELILICLYCSTQIHISNMPQVSLDFSLLLQVKIGDFGQNCPFIITKILINNFIVVNKWEKLNFNVYIIIC